MSLWLQQCPSLWRDCFLLHVLNLLSEIGSYYLRELISCVLLFYDGVYDLFAQYMLTVGQPRPILLEARMEIYTIYLHLPTWCGLGMRPMGLVCTTHKILNCFGRSNQSFLALHIVDLLLIDGYNSLAVDSNIVTPQLKAMMQTVSHIL